MKKFVLCVPLFLAFNAFAVTSYYGFRFTPTTPTDTLVITYQICLQAGTDGRSCVSYGASKTVRLDQRNQGTLISFPAVVPVMAPELKINSIVFASGSQTYTVASADYVRTSNPTDPGKNIFVDLKSYSLAILDAKTYLAVSDSTLILPNA